MFVTLRDQYYVKDDSKLSIPIKCLLCEIFSNKRSKIAQHKKDYTTVIVINVTMNYVTV